MLPVGGDYENSNGILINKITFGGTHGPWSKVTGNLKWPHASDPEDRRPAVLQTISQVRVQFESAGKSNSRLLLI